MGVGGAGVLCSHLFTLLLFVAVLLSGSVCAMCCLVLCARPPWFYVALLPLVSSALGTVLSGCMLVAKFRYSVLRGHCCCRARVHQFDELIRGDGATAAAEDDDQALDDSTLGSRRKWTLQSLTHRRDNHKKRSVCSQPSARHALLPMKERTKSETGSHPPIRLCQLRAAHV